MLAKLHNEGFNVNSIFATVAYKGRKGNFIKVVESSFDDLNDDEKKLIAMLKEGK